MVGARAWRGGRELALVMVVVGSGEWGVGSGGSGGSGEWGVGSGE